MFTISCLCGALTIRSILTIYVFLSFSLSPYLFGPWCMNLKGCLIFLIELVWMSTKVYLDKLDMLPFPCFHFTSLLQLS